MKWVAPLKFWVFLMLLGSILFAPSLLFAETVAVKGLRLWPSPDSVRIVLDADQPIQYKIFTLPHPDRLVLDLDQVSFQARLSRLKLAHTGIKSARGAPRGKNQYRLVFDLEHSSKPKHFQLPPTGSAYHRLVIDLDGLGGIVPVVEASTSTKNKENETASFNLAKVEIPSGVPKTTNPEHQPATIEAIEAEDDTKVNASRSSLFIPRRREFVVAIDPGHGGEDPGAKGPHGVQEKDVVLNISKKFSEMINKEPGMRAFLIRSGDYYVGLRKRMQLARSQGADLFISIHADAFHHPRAKGASVFVLSDRGSSSEAAHWLAQHENSSDLIGGISLDNKGDTLASVLLDLSQTHSRAASKELGAFLLESLGSISPLHKSTVEHAGFMVLKSPDIPSVLVETGFISNPEGERHLNHPHYQKKMAEALMQGVVKFYRSRPYLAEQAHEAPKKLRRYTVRKKDTMDKIAKRFKMSKNELISSNELKSDEVHVGQMLVIPKLEKHES